MTLETYGTEYSSARGLQITTANPNQQIKLAATCFSIYLQVARAKILLHATILWFQSENVNEIRELQGRNLEKLLPCSEQYRDKITYTFLILAVLTILQENVTEKENNKGSLILYEKLQIINIGLFKGALHFQ